MPAGLGAAAEKRIGGQSFNGLQPLVVCQFGIEPAQALRLPVVAGCRLDQTGCRGDFFRGDVTDCAGIPGLPDNRCNGGDKPVIGARCNQRHTLFDFPVVHRLL